MKIIKTYTLGFKGKQMREREEKKLFADGFEIESEEVIKSLNSGKACCLAIIFLPLVLFGRVKSVKVVYSNNKQTRADGSER